MTPQTIRIGSCSLCNGDVVATIMPPHSSEPPPTPSCSACGAILQGSEDPSSSAALNGEVKYTTVWMEWDL